MKTYMRKVGQTLLFGLVILAIAGIIYMVVPKYQIDTIGAIFTLIIWGVYIITLIYLGLGIKIKRKAKRELYIKKINSKT